MLHSNNKDPQSVRYIQAWSAIPSVKNCIQKPEASGHNIAKHS